MNILKTQQRLKTAKLVGSTYFLGLGLINFCVTFLYLKIYIIDFIILLFGLLPLLVNSGLFFLIFGSLAGLISLYMGFACLTLNLNPETHTSQSSYNMGYLLAVSSFLSSMLLFYVGLNLAEKRAIKLA